MKIKSSGYDYSNSKQTFGMKIYKDPEYRRTVAVLRGVFSNCDEFVKAINDSIIGGSKDAVNIAFFTIKAPHDGSLPAIRYSFWKKNEAQPITVHYCAVVDNLNNMKDKILKDCQRFISGEDDQMIEELNRVEVQKRLDRGLPMGNLRDILSWIFNK